MKGLNTLVLAGMRVFMSRLQNGGKNHHMNIAIKYCEIWSI